MDKKKWLLISSSALVIILVVFGTWLFLSRLTSKSNPVGSVINNQNHPSLPTPQFMNDADKSAFGLPADLKVQILGRDASGTVTVYKVIKQPSDIVADPSAVAPLSPRRLPAQ